MKKIFSQMWQWIIKNKKSLIYGVLALFVGQICFFGLWEVWVENQVFAQENWWELATQSSALNEAATKWYNNTKMIRKVIYVMIYPVLMLAWKLVDNSMVYGEVFGFDAVLWNLWVTVRNLANFALWFIFIYKIFSYLIKQDKNRDIKKLLIRTLIAWVGIQASWFVMMVLVDISTVMTYSVWWLPLTVLWDTKINNSEESKEEVGECDRKDPCILFQVTDVNAKDVDDTKWYLSNQHLWKNNYMSECVKWSMSTADGSGANKAFILAPKMVYYKNDNGQYFATEKLRCHAWGDVYHFWSLYEWIEWQSCSDQKTCDDAQADYDTSLNNVRETLKEKKDLSWSESLLEEWAVAWENWYWFDEYNKQIWKTRGLKKLSTILESGNYAWVFTVLYSSLIQAGEDLKFGETTDNSVYVNVLNNILSLCHMIAIGIPLIAMCAVFVMRIWVLWMAISLSPFIVLCMAFDLFESKFLKDLDILKHLKFSNLIGIIFSPVVICFAVSMSTVLVRIVSSFISTEIETMPTDILWWTIMLNIQWMWINVWKFICAVICVAITWFLVWAAVKSTELWKKLESLEKLATSAIWSVPIIPIPGEDGKTNYIGLSSAIGLNGQQWIIWNIWSKIASKYNAKDSQALSERLDPDEAKRQAEKKQQEVAETKIVDSYFAGLSVGSISWKWTDTPFGEWWKSFKTLGSSAQKKVIEKINWMDDSTRQKLWDSENTIKVWDDTYIFDNAEKKYVSKPSS